MPIATTNTPTTAQSGHQAFLKKRAVFGLEASCSIFSVMRVRRFIFGLEDGSCAAEALRFVVVLPVEVTTSSTSTSMTSGSISNVLCCLEYCFFSGSIDDYETLAVHTRIRTEDEAALVAALKFHEDF